MNQFCISSFCARWVSFILLNVTCSSPAGGGVNVPVVGGGGVDRWRDGWMEGRMEGWKVSVTEK